METKLITQFVFIEELLVALESEGDTATAKRLREALDKETERAATVEAERAYAINHLAEQQRVNAFESARETLRRGNHIF